MYLRNTHKNKIDQQQNDKYYKVKVKYISTYNFTVENDYRSQEEFSLKTIINYLLFY